MTALPQWAEDMRPVDMDGAAALLGVCRRSLVGLIRDHPHYEKRGSKKVFYREHIAALREALCQKSGERANGYEQKNSPRGSGGRSELLPDDAFDRVLELATAAGQPNSSRSSKPASGNVIPMAKRRSEHSRKRP